MKTKLGAALLSTSLMLQALTGCSSTTSKNSITSEQVKVYYKGLYGEDEEDIKMYFLNNSELLPLNLV